MMSTKTIKLNGNLRCVQNATEGAVFSENGKDFYSIGRTITNRLAMSRGESKKIKITVEVIE